MSTTTFGPVYDSTGRLMASVAHLAGWSKPFHGVSHFTMSGKRSWATLTDHGAFADLSLHFPGCGFNPAKQQHDTAEEAMAAAEAWMKDAA